MEQSRSPKELRTWVLKKCNDIASTPEAKKGALLRLRPFKAFYEELSPLSLYGVHAYGDREGILLTPNRDERRDFDATVRDGDRTVRIETTVAPDANDHLRMKHFLETGFVSMTGPVTVVGNKKTGRKIVVELEFVDHTETVAAHLELIKAAAANKAGPGRYGPGYELVIAIEDSWFDLAEDSEQVGTFLKKEVLSLPLSFDAVHVVGWTERLFQSLPVSRNPSSPHRGEVADG